MLVLLATFLGLLSHTLAQFPGDCDQESYVLPFHLHSCFKYHMLKITST